MCSEVPFIFRIFDIQAYKKLNECECNKYVRRLNRQHYTLYNKILLLGHSIIKHYWNHISYQTKHNTYLNQTLKIRSVLQHLSRITRRRT